MSFAPGKELTKEKHVCRLENSIPDDELLPTNGGPIHLPTSERVLKRFYASEGKCALWVFPYHCIQFKNSLKGNAISEDQLNDSPDVSSAKGIKKHVYGEKLKKRNRSEANQIFLKSSETTQKPNFFIKTKQIEVRYC